LIRVCAAGARRLRDGDGAFGLRLLDELPELGLDAAEEDGERLLTLADGAYGGFQDGSSMSGVVATGGRASMSARPWAWIRSLFCDEGA